MQDIGIVVRECQDESYDYESLEDDLRSKWMTLASGILFMIWVSIVMVGIGSYAMMMIIKQEKSLYSNWEDSDDDTFQDGVG